MKLETLRTYCRYSATPYPVLLERWLKSGGLIEWDKDTAHCIDPITKRELTLCFEDKSLEAVLVAYY